MKREFRTGWKNYCLRSETPSSRHNYLTVHLKKFPAIFPDNKTAGRNESFGSSFPRTSKRIKRVIMSRLFHSYCQLQYVPSPIHRITFQFLCRHSGLLQFSLPDSIIISVYRSASLFVKIRTFAAKELPFNGSTNPATKDAELRVPCSR